MISFLYVVAVVCGWCALLLLGLGVVKLLKWWWR